MKTNRGFSHITVAMILGAALLIAGVYFGGVNDSGYLSGQLNNSRSGITNYEACEKISDYYRCLTEAAIVLNDINFCRTIEDKNNSQVEELKNLYRDWCTAAIAENTKDYKLCDLLPEISSSYAMTKDFCYKKIECNTTPENCKLY